MSLLLGCTRSSTSRVDWAGAGKAGKGDPGRGWRSLGWGRTCLLRWWQTTLWVALEGRGRPDVCAYSDVRCAEAAGLSVCRWGWGGLELGSVVPARRFARCTVGSAESAGSGRWPKNPAGPGWTTCSRRVPYMTNRRNTKGVTTRVRHSMLGREVAVGVYGGGAKHPALPKGVEYPYPACLRTVRARRRQRRRICAGAVCVCACVCMLLHSGASCKLEAALLTIVSASTVGVLAGAPGTAGQRRRTHRCLWAHVLYRRRLVPSDVRS
eukprot:5634202-Prymnesium_polylepis.1